MTGKTNFQEVTVLIAFDFQPEDEINLIVNQSFPIMTPGWKHVNIHNHPIGTGTIWLRRREVPAKISSPAYLEAGFD